ncbi:MAG: type I restriction endonuclease, partial [Rhodobacteraceae bacterium]|nr:type I restriction endonuclease [Paracoccaceae bacterium]
CACGVSREDGSIGGDAARLIDFANADANDWLAANQFTVIEEQNNRRADVLLFVNGLLGVPRKSPPKHCILNAEFSHRPLALGPNRVRRSQTDVRSAIQSVS